MIDVQRFKVNCVRFARGVNGWMLVNAEQPPKSKIWRLVRFDKEEMSSKEWQFLILRVVRVVKEARGETSLKKLFAMRLLPPRISA